MTPLKAGQVAVGRLLSAVLSYSETLCSMLIVEQLHHSGHVEITEVLVDRLWNTFRTLLKLHTLPVQHVEGSSQEP
jgi:hypothetical protein